MTPGIVQLGRIGDILNVLPIAWELDNRGTRAAWIVQECYMPLFEGVSYVNPVPWFGDMRDVSGAAAELAKKHSPLLVTQTYGNRGFPRVCDSFSRESWDQAGFAGLWDTIPTVFDRRDDLREEALRRSASMADGPTILLAMEGHSSPLENWNLIADAIAERWFRQYTIINISQIRARRFFDLLGLMERADVLVAIDSAPLHLGAAVRIPTVALVADRPTAWHGSANKSHWLARVPYAEAMDRIDEIHEAIRRTAGLKQSRSRGRNGGSGAAPAKSA